MVDEAKIGTVWNDDELDIIVADYFAMLALDSAGQPFVKARRAEVLMHRTGRTHRSVEFKLMNISAVAETLGLPKVRGYRPMYNIQNAIFAATDRYLTANPETLGNDALLPVAQRWGGGATPLGAVTEGATPSFQGVAESSFSFGMAERPQAKYTTDAPRALVMTEAPMPSPGRSPRPEGFVRLVRKFDPAARDHRNRALGLMGEERVFQHERARLIAADRPDLARKIEWTSQERGDGAGYDIRSFDPTGEDRFIEVKATRGGPTTPFYLTRNEREVSMERPAAWSLYRLHDISTEPHLFILPPPLEASVRLEAENWKASF